MEMEIKKTGSETVSSFIKITEELNMKIKKYQRDNALTYKSDAIVRALEEFFGGQDE